MNGNKTIKLQGTVGHFPELFVSSKQMKHKEYKRLQLRNKAVDKEQLILDAEFRDNAYNMAKLKIDILKQEERENGSK